MKESCFCEESSREAKGTAERESESFHICFHGSDPNAHPYTSADLCGSAVAISQESGGLEANRCTLLSWCEVKRTNTCGVKMTNDT